MLRKGISPEARVAKLTHGCDEEDFFFKADEEDDVNIYY